MPINTDLNVSPYFDDYDDTKNYRRILFRPSVPVQARELTQLQTMLQDQIEKFGSWAFKNGDIVEGCNISTVPQLPYIRLQDFQTNSASFEVSDFLGAHAVSEDSGLTARILYANSGLEATYPNTNIIYVDYINTGDNGEVEFSNNETINFYRFPRTDVLTGASSNDCIAVVNTFANSTTDTYTTGNAYGIHVSEGVVYLNGTFVRVTDPAFGLVNTYGTYAANQVSGFILTERIVTENQDESLLDNALGYPNENAPGAHRLKLTANLISLTAEEAAETDAFNPIAVFNYGSLVSKTVAGSNLYSIVESSIAQRLYDQTGNYVVNPFVVDFVTNAQSNTDITANNAFVIDANSVFGRIGPGVGYASGSRVSVEKTAYIEMRRGVDTQTEFEKQITFNYGGYLRLNETAGSFAFNSAETVQLYDAPQTAVTRRLFSSLTPQGNNIGTAQLRCFSYLNGVIGTNTANYALHIFNINLKSGYSTDNIKSVYYNGSSKAVGDVISKGTVASDQKQQLFAFGNYGIKEIPVAGTNYVYRAKVPTQMGTDGVVPVNVPVSGQELPYGVGNLPELEAASINLIVTANTDSAVLTGTVTVSTTNTSVIGAGGTTFTTKFSAGDQIKVGSDIRTVVSVANATFLTVDAPFSSTASGQNHYKTYVVGKILPISYGDVSGGYVQIVNTSYMSIHSGQIPVGAMDVDVVFDVMRTSAYPATKEIRKHRFVKLNLATLANVVSLTGSVTVSTSSNAVTGSSTTFNTDFNVGDLIRVSGTDRRVVSITNSTYLTVNAAFGSSTTTSYSKVYTSSKTGPWSLGLPDIHKIRGIYGSADNSYAKTNLDLTRNFIFDSGQRDTHYALGQLYAKPGWDATTYPNLLVELDYFAVNTSTGSGYFSIESYPIDDVNTANTNAIQTKDIPLYVSESGQRISLRDFVDFRIPCKPTAADTEEMADPANTTQISTAIGKATINPSSTVTYDVPAAGLSVPSYGRNFEADYTVYLPRRDLIFITPENKIKVKEGLSSSKPQAPLWPDNAMALAIINVPPYPSLSSDQVDEFLAINQSSINLVRDTRLAINSSLVTNRRYTMRDIGKLDDRITNLEYYTQLSLVEKKAADMTITDAYGLNRFKNGIFVEPFSDFSLADVSNPEYSMAIDQKKGVGRPSIRREVINVSFNKNLSTNANNTGRLVTLPYTEKNFITQPYATKWRSAALLAYAWNGTLKLIPAFDNHNDTINTGSINIVVDVAKPWIDFANSPFGQTWGDWQTTTSVDTKSVVSGTSVDLNLGFLGYFFGPVNGMTAQQQAEAKALLLIHQMYGNNVTIGKLVVTYSDIRLKRDISFLGWLFEGLGLYKYRYLWSDVTYIGVMAQEVLNYMPEAVSVQEDGYMAVDYAKLGVPLYVLK